MPHSRFAETYAGRPHVIAMVRDDARLFLAGHVATDDVLLILSEFATNAVRHSLSCVGVFHVVIQKCTEYVYVEVVDEGGPWLPAEEDDRPHGLDIVTELTDRDWGVDIDPAGQGNRIVWARVHFITEAAGRPPCDSSGREAVPPLTPLEAASPPAPLPGVVPLYSRARRRRVPRRHTAPPRRLA